MEICDDAPVFGESTFSLNYRKLNNRDFFASLEESELGIVNSKNYMPIYENYFNLNETNYNSINLNQRFYVSALSGVVDKNNIQAAVVDAFKSTSESLTILHKPIFIKFSPLIDPVKYMLGKYESLNANGDILDIPVLSKLDRKGLLKANDKNNAAYVDSFFSYLSSQVLNCHEFIHGLNFYGSFNAIKKDFYYNVIDDIECLDKNPYFNKNKNILFEVEDIEFSDDDDDGDDDNHNEYANNDNDSNHSNYAHRQQKNTRNKKEKITIETNKTIDESTIVVHDEFDKISNELNSIFNTFSSNTDSKESEQSEPSELPCNEDLLILKLDDIVADNSNIIEEVDGIVLNKDSHFGNDSDSNDSFTSGSCSSRSSYTSDGQPDGNDGSGSDCEIDDIICLDDTVYGGKDGKDVKDNKNKKRDKKSKNGSEEYYSEEGSADESGDNSNNDGEGEDEYDDEDGDEDGDEDDEYDDDETLWATIKNFPVSAIMLEKCENTLDSLMMQEKEMTENEWRSALMQVIMTLITYQKLFGFTHNDLHTNNIMYIYTEKEYIYYHYNKKYYRVPTYNRVFKIIDFGRAIYKYKSKVICSDSFSMTGDAATQYNCEPYFNDKKPRLEPNYSFDLCRLGCSIFDYFIDDISNVAAICKKEPLSKLIVEWVTDDQNRNILYKANGEERYPDFKLYKMIARSVHNHTPQAQLSKPIFADYEFPKKKVKSSHRILNIDKMPSYME